MAVKNLMGAVLTLSLVAHVFGHGYMTSPAARNSAWRFGFPTPVNYDDDGIRCGGVPQVRMWQAVWGASTHMNTEKSS